MMIKFKEKGRSHNMRDKSQNGWTLSLLIAIALLIAGQFTAEKIASGDRTPRASAIIQTKSNRMYDDFEWTSPTPAQYDYVLNTNTLKFHYPSCASVKRIKSTNRENFTGTRDQVIQRGYTPCKNCYP